MSRSASKHVCMPAKLGMTEVLDDTLKLDDAPDVNAGDDEGNTPLHWAARGGHADSVKLLCRRGADVNVANSTGATPLHWAVASTHKSLGGSNIIEILVQNGADVNIGDNKGNTPMHWAAQHSQIQALDTLRRYGADRDITNNQGKNVLATAWTDSVKKAVAPEKYPNMLFYQEQFK